jgi:hypothetical protein
MTLSVSDEQRMRSKQLELGLSDEECRTVVNNAVEFFRFSDRQADFAEFILRYLEEICCGLVDEGKVMFQ